jgi:hypothetical protein
MHKSFPRLAKGISRASQCTIDMICFSRTPWSCSGWRPHIPWRHRPHLLILVLARLCVVCHRPSGDDVHVKRLESLAFLCMRYLMQRNINYNKHPQTRLAAALDFTAILKCVTT